MDPCPLCDAPLDTADALPPQTPFSKPDMEDQHGRLLEVGERTAGVGPAQLTFAVHRDLKLDPLDLERAQKMTIEHAIRYLRDRYPGMLKITHDTNPFRRDDRLTRYNIFAADDPTVMLQPDEESPPRRTFNPAEDLLQAVQRGVFSANEARQLAAFLDPPAPVVPARVAIATGAEPGEQHEDRSDDGDDPRQAEEQTQPEHENCEKDRDQDADHG